MTTEISRETDPRSKREYHDHHQQKQKEAPQVL
jgi:hypothetical protein